MRILYLDLDSVRPDHLGCYGYHRQTSPNIDRIAAEGVRFDRCYASDAPCMPSRTALFSGRFGIQTGVVGHGGTPSEYRIEGRDRVLRSKLTSQSLPAFLRSAGLRTATISPFAERHSAYHFLAGFNEMQNTGGCGMESAEEVTPTVMRWLEQHAAEDNWFLQVNYWDAHTPYRVPEGYGNPFEGEPIPAWLTEEVYKKHKAKVGPKTVNELNAYNNKANPAFPRFPGEIKDMATLRLVIDGYDTAIRYIDDHLGLLFDKLAALGVLEDTVIVISADHGENMGELGIYTEHGTADDITCRVPMIIRWPGEQQGTADGGLHYQLDLAPTLAEMLGREPLASWHGSSFAPALRDGRPCGQPYLVLSQCAHVCQRSVRFGPWLYMRTYHDGFHLFPEEMLFNIEEDPHEQHNVADGNRQVCLEAVYRLNDWHDRMMQTMDSDIDPMWTVIREGGPYHARGKLAEYCERLAVTERGEAIDKLKRRHPGEFA